VACAQRSGRHEAFGFNDSNQVVGRVSGVPGPMVGAGLPDILLAVAGFIGWRRSRRALKMFNNRTIAPS
jgi:hypothetical protein